MSRWSFDVSCPACGSDVRHVTATKPHGTLTCRTAAVVACVSCTREWLLVVELASTTPPGVDRNATDDGGPLRCGTERGYHLHRRIGETPCTDCKQAHADYEAVRRRRARHTGSPALFEIAGR